MFRIKICGITRPEDGRMAAEAGADAIGLNFYRGSRRFIDTIIAQTIVSQLPSGVAKVGVFVNASREEIEAASDLLGLDFVQLHGDEPPEALALISRPIIRAFRLGAAGWTPVVEYLAACRRLDCVPVAMLIDSDAPGSYGGTGQTTNWNVVRQRPPELANLSLILAGGLTPENVAQAVTQANPSGVDTASGVEQAPGVKDAHKVRRFVSQAKGALTANLNPKSEI